MTHADRELTVREGAPIELYRWTFEGAETFETSGDEAVTFDGDTYPPALVHRREQRQTDSAEQSGAFEVEVPLTHPIAQLFQAGQPASSVLLRLIQLHRGETDVAVQALAVVASLSQPDLVTGVLACRTAEALMVREVPTLRVLAQCPHYLGDELCQVDVGPLALTAEVAAVAGAVVTVTGLAAHAGADPTFFAGGKLLKGGWVKGFIEETDGDDVHLDRQPIGIVATDTVTVEPGCDGDIRTCRTRFDNILHHGGFHALPVRNPLGDHRGLRELPG